MREKWEVVHGGRRRAAEHLSEAAEQVSGVTCGIRLSGGRGRLEAKNYLRKSELVVVTDSRKPAPAL
jgi:hypothetical protein